jgi:hypothetical protein
MELFNIRIYFKVDLVFPESWLRWSVLGSDDLKAEMQKCGAVGSPNVRLAAAARVAAETRA